MRVQCPQCLIWFDWNEFKWSDGNGTFMPQLKSRPAGRIASLLDRLQGVKWATDDERAQLLSSGFRMSCPTGDWVPDDLDKQLTYVIAVVGPPASSKTHYLAASLQLLRQGGLATFSVSAHMHRWSQPIFNVNYFERLWRQRKTIPRTSRRGPRDSIAPLAIELRHTWSGRKWNLVFFDSAGEDLLDSEKQAAHSRYLATSYGVIFFIDPASFPTLRSLLAAKAGYETPHGADDIVYRTAHTLRAIHGLPETYRFDNLPVAIVIAKSDLLDGDEPELAEWSRLNDWKDSDVRPDDLNRIRMRSDAIAECIERSGGANLILTVGNAFPRHTYHLVSATGCKPESDGSFSSVEPQRCLDPIVSILWDGRHDLGGDV